MLGIVLGLASSVTFGANSIIARRGVLRVSSDYIAIVSIFTGLAFFILVTAVTGDLYVLARLTWKSYFFWALSGVIHFALGRTWAYRSLQLLGANRSNIVTSLSPIATVVLAMLLLKETVTPLQALGITFTLSGPILMLLKEQTYEEGSSTQSSAARGKEINARDMFLGVLYGAGAALFWGSSGIFIKFGLDAGGSPVVGSLIAYAAATLVISPSLLFSAEKRREIVGEGGKPLPIAMFSGVTTSVAQLLRYLSFGFGSVIVVSLMLRTQPLWILLFAFIFIRQYESFSRWVIIGNGLLMIGTLLIIF